MPQVSLDFAPLGKLKVNGISEDLGYIPGPGRRGETSAGFFRGPVGPCELARKRENRTFRDQSLVDRKVLPGAPSPNGVLRLLKCHGYFAGLPWCRHSATRSETFASPTHMTVSAPPQ